MFGEEEAGAVVLAFFEEIGEEFERNPEMVFRKVQVVREREAFFSIGGAGREGLAGGFWSFRGSRKARWRIFRPIASREGLAEGFWRCRKPRRASGKI